MGPLSWLFQTGGCLTVTTIDSFHCVYRQADPVAMELGCVRGSSYGEHNSLGESGEVVDSRLEVATAHLR